MDCIAFFHFNSQRLKWSVACVCATAFSFQFAARAVGYYSRGFPISEEFPSEAVGFRACWNHAFSFNFRRTFRVTRWPWPPFTCLSSSFSISERWNQVDAVVQPPLVFPTCSPQRSPKGVAGAENGIHVKSALRVIWTTRARFCGSSSVGACSLIGSSFHKGS